MLQVEEFFEQLREHLADNLIMVTPMGWRMPDNAQINSVYNDYEPTLESQCVTMNMPDWALRSAGWQGLDHSLEPSLAQWQERIATSVRVTQGFETLVYFIGGQQRVTVDQQLFALLSQPFHPKPTSAATERAALQNAIVLFEMHVLPKAYVSEDVGGWRGNNMISCSALRQQDCYDEQASLLPFLVALKAAGFLVFHDIEGEVMNFNGEHCANALVETAMSSGAASQHWVVDSWVNDQVELPVILPLDAWLQKDWH